MSHRSPTSPPARPSLAPRVAPTVPPSAWRRCRGAWRGLRLLAHIAQGLWTYHLHFPRLTAAQRQQAVQAWAEGLLAKIGISLQRAGTPAPTGPVLLVANHISWLDIVTMHAARYCRFVSKADIRQWPLVGSMADAADTLYIQRESRRDAMRVVHHMAESLRAGDVVAVFPEGTTSDGLQMLPFHANLLQAAIAVDAPVQPVAITYVDAASRALSLAPCYIGNDTLLVSIWRTLTSPAIEAVVRYGDPEPHHGRDRRQWAADLQAEIARLRAH